MSIIFSDGAEMLSRILSEIFTGIFTGIFSGIFTGIFSGALSVMVPAHALWHKAAYRGAESCGQKSRGKKLCRAEG